MARPKRHAAARYIQKIRSGVDVNKGEPLPLPRTITEIDEKLVGKRVWYFHPTDGVSFVTVTGIYRAVGRNHKIKYGLEYEGKNRAGGALTKMLWVKDYTLFDSRMKCNRWLAAMIERSEADMVMNKALGIE